jgi:hypothetical protein
VAKCRQRPNTVQIILVIAQAFFDRIDPERKFYLVVSNRCVAKFGVANYIKHDFVEPFLLVALQSDRVSTKVSEQ